MFIPGNKLYLMQFPSKRKRRLPVVVSVDSKGKSFLTTLISFYGVMTD